MLKYVVALLLLLFFSTAQATTDFVATDPGVRGGDPGAGGPLPGLTPNELAFFNAGLQAFVKIVTVPEGLGPRYNLDNCGECHSQPSIGGSSPANNPQIDAATRSGAVNTVPSFIKNHGPVREVRVVLSPDGTPDGNVHTLFVISGRSDAPGCDISQEDFETLYANGNIIFRIPTPIFGDGLIEAIADKDILANQAANAAIKTTDGIGGRPNRVNGSVNRSGNDGTITRFGWKAQNKSMLIFAGEAYNAEMGVTNELFPNERYEDAQCIFNGIPESETNFDSTSLTDMSSDPVRFSHFMRMLAPPQPASDDYLPGIPEGRQLFVDIGCALCHTPSFTTQTSSIATMSNKQVNLYSDLLIHHMGPKLADGVSQGIAGGDEFRTAPLWGLGQRIFFLHDGRTKDLDKAIRQHKSGSDGVYPASEANTVIKNYKDLSEEQKQYLLNFLRSL